MESVDQIAASLVIDTTEAGVGGALLCFVVFASGANIKQIKPALRSALRSELSPRHVSNEFIRVADVAYT